MTELDKIINELEWEKRMYELGIKNRDVNDSYPYRSIIFIAFLSGILIGMLLINNVIPWISNI